MSPFRRRAEFAHAVPEPNPCLRLAVRRSQSITSLIKELAAKQGSLLCRLAGPSFGGSMLQSLLNSAPTVGINDRIMLTVKYLFLVPDAS